jgi:hypothetical protein
MALDIPATSKQQFARLVFTFVHFPADGEELLVAGSCEHERKL